MCVLCVESTLTELVSGFQFAGHPIVIRQQLSAIYVHKKYILYNH